MTNWWQHWVTAEYRCARETWESERERACNGYAAEEADWTRSHPGPTFKQFLVALANPYGMRET